MILTNVAVPGIFLIKLFGSSKELKAILDLWMLGLRFLRVLSVSGVAIKAQKTRKHSLRLSLDDSVNEDQFKLECEMSSDVIVDRLFSFIDDQVILVIIR